ncbi:MAG: hypothetical protein GYB53_15095 [Rhodobacteraceae bacterium]|nr:hypothetical protein [Paracoccaceae bacterium]MBR9823736.1 hypothetical protein [Paracoccaceae bacterium]
MVKGRERFRRKMLHDIPDAIRAEVIKQLEKEAAKVVEAMRRLVPVRTGALFRSIGWTWGAAPAGAVVLGRVAQHEFSRIAITIYAGGTEATARQQSRASGTRARDQKRPGTFDTDNARFQEFGTINMPANPFFFPAWRSERNRVNANLRRAIKRGVRKGGN